MFLNNLRSKTTERATALDAISLARYGFASRFVQNKKVLDIGTGFGEGAYYMAQKGAKIVLGIDYFEPVIIQARKNFRLPNLDFKTINALDILSLNERFDVITAFEVIEHLPFGSYSNFIAKIKEMLNPKGICLISTPNKLVYSPNQAKPHNPYHQKEFTPKEFLQLAKKHFPQTTLMGIRCVNKNYSEKRKLVQKRLGNKIAVFLSKFKITHELTPFIPKRLRQAITSEKLLPSLKASNFKISRKNINKCEGLLILCKSSP